MHKHCIQDYIIDVDNLGQLPVLSGLLFQGTSPLIKCPPPFLPSVMSDLWLDKSDLWLEEGLPLAMFGHYRGGSW